MRTIGELFFRKNGFFNFLFSWLIVGVLTLLVRLPHILSPNFWFDGDEAIIGIMAQDFLAGGRLPIYFYGQNYGFSTIEVLSTALFEKLIGPDIWSLRLGGLFLFSLAITFLVKGLIQKNISRKIIIVCLLLIVTYPPWYLWGMMVRGGYLTAFLFSSLLFYQFQKESPTKLNLLFIGIAIGLVFESHLLLLIALFPLILIWFLNTQNKFKTSLFVGVSMLFSVGLIRFFGTIENPIWKSPKINLGWSLQWESLLLHIKGALSAFGNFFYFEESFSMPLWWTLFIVLFLLISLFWLVSAYKTPSQNRKLFYWMIVFSILIYLFILSTIHSFSPRYWLALFTGLLFWLLFSLENEQFNGKRNRVIWILTAISLIGIGNGKLMKKDWYPSAVNESEAFTTFYEKTKELGASAIFITDMSIQWEWNYLYGNEIPAAFFSNEDRTNKYRDKVETYYKQSPEKVILGGHWGIFLGMDEVEGFNEHRMQIAEKYFLNPFCYPEYIQAAKRRINKED